MSTEVYPPELHSQSKRNSDPSVNVFGDGIVDVKYDKVVKMEQPQNTPERIWEESVAGIPPPRNLPKNTPLYDYKPTWESLESRPIPEWYEDAKVCNLNLEFNFC